MDKATEIDRAWEEWSGEDAFGFTSQECSFRAGYLKGQKNCVGVWHPISDHAPIRKALLVRTYDNQIGIGFQYDTGVWAPLFGMKVEITHWAEINLPKEEK